MTQVIQTKKNILGKTSLTLGIISPFVFGILGIPAIILGALGLKRKEKLAKAGLVLGILSIVLWSVLILVSPSAIFGDPQDNIYLDNLGKIKFALDKYDQKKGGYPSDLASLASSFDLPQDVLSAGVYKYVTNGWDYCVWAERRGGGYFTCRVDGCEKDALDPCSTP